MIGGNLLKAEVMGGGGWGGGIAKRYGRNGMLHGETTEYGPNAMHTRNIAGKLRRIIMLLAFKSRKKCG